MSAPVLERLTLILDEEPHGAALNMAVDEVLLAGARAPLLRVYGWAAPAASFGYFVRFAEAEKVAAGRELVRRWTGGGIVLHGDDFTYSLVLPRREPLAGAPSAESYRKIHAALAKCLAGAHLVDLAHEKRSDSCFENAVVSDVLQAGRKIAGAAQRRNAQGLLHQGSVQSRRVPGDLGRRLAERLAGTVDVRTLSEAELEKAAELARAKYALDSWLRRR